MNQPGPLSRWAGLGRAPTFCLLLLIGLAFYLPGFTGLPAVDRDEAHFAQASKQMLETGNYVDIRFQQTPRYNKPIGIYWLQAAAVSLAGLPANVIWPYRLPSLMGALLALVFLVRIGERLFDRRTGLIAALLLGACMVLGVEARLAKTDAVLLACTLAAYDGLLAVYLGSGRRAQALQFWIALSLGILVKGPVLPLVLIATFVPLNLIERRWRWLGRLEPRIGLPLTLAVVAPWLIAIGIASQGHFFSQSLGHDFGAKLVGGEETHGFPPGFYLLAFAVTFWPGGLIFAAALPGIWRRRKEPAIRFLLCWLIPAWIGMELVPTKLPHYVLPLYPAVALLAGTVFADGERPFAGGWPLWLKRAGAGLWFITGFALAAGVAVMGWRLDGSPDPIALLTLLAVTAAMAWTILQFSRGRREPGLCGLVAASLLLQAGGFGLALERIDPLWVSRSAERLVAANAPCPRPTLAVAGDWEPSLIFLLGTDTAITDGAGAAQFLKKDPGTGCNLAFVSPEQDAAFRAALGQDSPRGLGALAGLDYSTGSTARLALYARP